MIQVWSLTCIHRQVVRVDTELWVKKKKSIRYKSLYALDDRADIFPSPYSASLPPFPFLPWLLWDSLRRTSVFLLNKTLTCFGGEGWFAFICPFKIFYTPTFWPNTLRALKYPSFCFLFWREACSVSAWGVFRHSEIPNATFFLHCTRSRVIHHFHSLSGSPTRVFKLASRKMMKSLPGREAFSWDVGRGEETSWRNRGEICTCVFCCPWISEVTWVLIQFPQFKIG